MTKIINDPVHGFNQIPNELIQSCIDHRYFQRLRFISQLGLTSFVYPGAIHSRFHHALGAYHLMSLAITQLRKKGVEITPEEEEGATIAVLYHDLGHGPFSHTLEGSIVPGIAHEAISLELMQKINKEFEGKLEVAIQIFTDTHPKKFLHQLVSSQLDVDRLDYLKRDSFYTGVVEGNIGVSRILAMLDVVDNEIVVHEKGIVSILNYLQSRSLMYWQVYLHKTVLSAEYMLVKIFERLNELNQSGNLDINLLPHNLQFIFNKSGLDNDFNNFTKLDDSDVWQMLKILTSHSDVVLKTLSYGLLTRKLYKVSDVLSLKNMENLSKKVSEELLPYFSFKGEVSKENYSLNSPIKILTKNKELVDFHSLAQSKGLITASVTKVQNHTYFFGYPEKNLEVDIKSY